MKKCVLAVVTSLLGLLIAAGSFGQGNDDVKKDKPPQRDGQGRGQGQFGPGGMMGGQMSSMLPSAIVLKILSDQTTVSDLGIPEDKLKAVKDSLEQGQKKGEELRAQLQEAEQARRKLMEDYSSDENALISSAEKLSQLRLEMDKSNIKQLVLLRKNLTQDQTNKIKDKAKQMLQERFKNMRENKGSEGGPRPERPAGK
jgi:vacuolar-type H+-ATPase subunit I/STV1